MTSNICPSADDLPMPVLIAEGKTSSISENLLNGCYNDCISSDDIMMPKLIAEGSKPSKRKRKLSFRVDVKNEYQNGVTTPHLKKKKSSSPKDNSFCEVKSSKRQRVNPGPVEVFFLPLKEGWVREVVSRNISDSSKNDIYYHPPYGKKLRSRVEIGKFLESQGIKHLTLENFTFFSDPLGYGGPFEVCREAQVISPKKFIKSSPSDKIQEKQQKRQPKVAKEKKMPQPKVAKKKKMLVVLKDTKTADNAVKDIKTSLPILKIPKKKAKETSKAKNKKAKRKKLFVSPKKVEESSDEEHQVITEIAEDDGQVKTIYTAEGSFVECKVEEEVVDEIVGVQIQQEIYPLLQENYDSSNQNRIDASRTTLVKESTDQLSHIHVQRESLLDVLSSQEANSPVTGNHANSRDTPRGMSEERRNGGNSHKPVEFYYNTTINDTQCKGMNTTTDRVTDSNDSLNVRKKKKKRLKNKKEKNSDILFVETGIVKSIKQEKEEEGNDFFPIISGVTSGPEVELELDDSLHIPLKLWYDVHYESEKREKKSEVQIIPQVNRSVGAKVYTNQKKSDSSIAKLTHNLSGINIYRSSNKTKIKDALSEQAPKPVTETNSPIPIMPPQLQGVKILKMCDHNATISENNKRQLIQAGKSNSPSASSKTNIPTQFSSWSANQVKNKVLCPPVSSKEKVSIDASHNPAISSSPCSFKTSSVQFSAANQIHTIADNSLVVSVPDQLPMALALSSL